MAVFRWPSSVLEKCQNKVDTIPKQNKMPEMPVLRRWNYILFSENIIYVYLEMVYGGIARLIFSQICQEAFTKRQLKYSLDLKIC